MRFVGFSQVFLLLFVCFFWCVCVCVVFLKSILVLLVEKKTYILDLEKWSCKWPWVKRYSHSSIIPRSCNTEKPIRTSLSVIVMTLGKKLNILQPHISCHTKINLSPSTGSKDLGFFACMEKESGKVDGMGIAKGRPDPAACLRAHRENGRTTLQQKQLSRCLQVDFRAMTQFGNPLVGLRKKGKAIGCT